MLTGHFLTDRLFEIRVYLRADVWRKGVALSETYEAPDHPA